MKNKHVYCKINNDAQNFTLYNKFLTLKLGAVNMTLADHTCLSRIFCCRSIYIRIFHRCIFDAKVVVPCQNKIILKNFRPVGRPS